MNFEAIPLFGVMQAKLGYLSARQNILAQNIANADTPEYQAQDIKVPDFKAAMGAAGHLQMVTTNKKHLTGSAGLNGGSTVIFRDSTFERNPDGNNVAIEEEMAKVAENQAEYQKVVSIYRKSIDMFKTAIGKTGG